MSTCQAHYIVILSDKPDEDRSDSLIAAHRRMPPVHWPPGLPEWASLYPNVATNKHSSRDNRQIARFFMIGTGAAGKTTVVRQLKCLCKERPKNYKAITFTEIDLFVPLSYANSVLLQVFDSQWNEIPVDSIFSSEEMSTFRKIIRNNIMKAVYNLIQQTIDWGNDCQASKSVEAIVAVVENGAKDGKDAFEADVPSSLEDDVLEILRDPNIAETLEKHHKMARKWRIEDGTLKFLSEKEIKRIFSDNVELTTIDIVHARYVSKLEMKCKFHEFVDIDEPLVFYKYNRTI
ncbi:hypothetical protein COOONC_25754 [Cooperia oncophora]